MTNSHKILLAVLLAVALALPACGGRSRPPKITKQMGHPIMEYGIFIDVEHNPKVDRMFKNYRVLTVAITNRSLNPFRMSAEKDVWKIQDGKGKWATATNTFRISNPTLWNKLPKKMQLMIDYPNLVPINHTQTFDIFLPKFTEIKGYKKIKYFNDTYRQTIYLLPPP